MPASYGEVENIPEWGRNNGEGCSVQILGEEGPRAIQALDGSCTATVYDEEGFMRLTLKFLADRGKPACWGVEGPRMKSVQQQDF
jgi:hypothetical protein